MPERLTVSERLGAIDLIADYAYTLESGDIDGYVDNFTPDGTLEFRSGRHQGRDAIRALVSHLYAIGQDGPGGNRHILGLPHVAGTPDGCAAHTYVMIVSGEKGDRPPAASFGQYADLMAWSGGRWRFASRRLIPVPAPAGDSDGGTATPRPPFPHS